MIEVVREDGVCVAQVRCDGCGAPANIFTPIDPAELVFQARLLRCEAAARDRWVRVALYRGGVAIFCPRCWETAEIREIR